MPCAAGSSPEAIRFQRLYGHPAAMPLRAGFYALVARTSYGGTRLRPSMAHSPRIVFVNRYFYPDQSATSRMLTDLACRLAERGLSVAVVTSRQLYENPRAALPPYEVVHGVSIHRVSTAVRGRARLAGRA